MGNINPCPFCGGTDIEMFVDFIQCSCGATMVGDSSEEILNKWNTRNKKESSISLPLTSCCEIGITDTAEYIVGVER